MLHISAKAHFSHSPLNSGNLSAGTFPLDGAILIFVYYGESLND